MRLKQIKLAGFKSFVDPTTVLFPSNRCAVVGPNGCGKSNIIDAVRWVMGESSAKQLRGEALTDVIFNGSGTRAATSLASIELTFDNSDMRIGGEFARYAEISIRREVTRDSQSTYYLNGQKCRRRDILDVFLGTGFGPRSYSIIEQGMISQLVEAKPEELRTYLEEAAGISKYKERRRETENRISRTLENLDRINDIRSELARQISQLERAAKAAEKYRDLKREQRRKTAELHVIRLDQAAAELARQESELRRKEVLLEEAAAEQQTVASKLEAERDALRQRNDELNDVLGRTHKIGADIARLETAIRHGEERLGELEADLATVRERAGENVIQLRLDEERIAAQKAAIEEKKPQLEVAHQEEEATAASLAETEQKLADWRWRWEDFNRRAGENLAEIQLTESRIEHQGEVIATLRRRDEHIEQHGDAEQPAQGEASDLSGTIAATEVELAELDQAIEESAGQHAQTRIDAEAQDRLLDEARVKVQNLRHELAALEAVQAVALGHREGDSEWASKFGLDEAPRLGEELTVQPGWESAVEAVLGNHLKAIRVDRVADHAEAAQSMENGEVVLYEAQGDALDEGHELPSLKKFVRASNRGVGSFLVGVFAAESLAEALQHQHRLEPGQSIVTRDGLHIGLDWLRVDRRSEEEGGGVIRRGHEIDVLRGNVEQAQGELHALQTHAGELRRTMETLAEQREDLLARRATAQASLSSARSEHEAHLARREEAAARVERIERERGEIRTQMAEATELRTEAETRLARLGEVRVAIDGERERLEGERATCEAALEAARERAKVAKDALHQLRVESEGLVSSLTASETARDRLIEQRKEFEQRIESLNTAIDDTQRPLPENRETLARLLAERLEVEHELGDSRRLVEEREAAIKNLDETRLQTEQVMEEMRRELEDARIEARGMTVEKQTIEAQLAETGFTEAEVRESLPQEEAEEAQGAAQEEAHGAAEEVWRDEIDKLTRRIERLGNINLAAIEELETTTERKAYLDNQHDDLEQALATLRNAIGSIDRETRTRFKETFDAVNARLGQLFPKVFGGGRAELRLTGEDMLDAGLTMTAQPPGKRNASIHLLSGGEKALTAIALIFAIFQLNPSPVCLLDEVDAPLDDTNVSRFADLIREMSSDVQFVIITHNKLTMEMADQLMGVTMNEPGVSRMVSVDVTEAVQLAAV